MSLFDIIIHGGIIIDGTGAPPFRADIGIKRDKIVKIGDLSNFQAEIIINAKDLIVSPGFIDIHNHSDLSIFAVPTADNYVMQGVTTIVIGNCGMSAAPITDINKDFMKDTWQPFGDGIIPRWDKYSEYLEALNELKKSINVAPLIGHGAIRSAILGTEDVKPTERQLNEMKKLVVEAMELGIFGMSSGLIYIPGVFAETKELMELAKVVARYNGIYTVHMRNEGSKLIDSIMEMINISINSGVSLQISHLKSFGLPNWGKVSIALSLISYYIERGFDISADAYPYTAASTTLLALLPSWIREGGIRRAIERLANPDTIEKLAKDLEAPESMERMFIDWSRIYISSSPKHKDLEGKNIETIAKELGIDPLKAVAKLIIEDEGSTEIIDHGMSEEDVTKVIAHPYIAICSDGRIRKFGIGKPHPRNYGTFPRVIAKYVREEKRMSLVEAVRKMSSLPARKLRLWDRGIIRPGMKADIVIFNYYIISDTATFNEPHNYPRGIKYVIVNGEIVIEEEKHTGNMPGKLLRKN